MGSSRWLDECTCGHTRGQHMERHYRKSCCMFGCRCAAFIARHAPKRLGRPRRPGKDIARDMENAAMLVSFGDPSTVGLQLAKLIVAVCSELRGEQRFDGGYLAERAAQQPTEGGGERHG